MRRIFLLAVPFWLVACGGEDPAVSPSPEAQATEAASPTSSPTPEGPYISVEDNDFVPFRLTVPAGEELTLANVGDRPHTFTIEAADIDVELEAGATTSLPVEIPPGAYVFICRFHDSMDGRLTVS